MFVIKNMFFPEAVSANKNQSFVKTIGGHTRDGSFMPVPGCHTLTQMLSLGPYLRAFLLFYKALSAGKNSGSLHDSKECH